MTFHVTERTDLEGFGRLTLQRGASVLSIDVPMTPYDILKGDEVDVRFSDDVPDTFGDACHVLQFKRIRAWDRSALFSAGGLLMITEETSLPHTVFVTVARCPAPRGRKRQTEAPTNRRVTRSSGRTAS